MANNCFGVHYLLFVCPIWEERGRAAEGEVPKAIIPQEIAEPDKKYLWIKAMLILN